jgi:hypothetical protein
LGAPSNIEDEDGYPMTALNIPLLSGVMDSEEEAMDEPPLAWLYILNMKEILGEDTGFPLESVSLPSYPIICGIAAKDTGEAIANMMKNTAKYFLSIELLN